MRTKPIHFPSSALTPPARTGYCTLMARRFKYLALAISAYTALVGLWATASIFFHHTSVYQRFANTLQPPVLVVWANSGDQFHTVSAIQINGLPLNKDGYFGNLRKEDSQETRLDRATHFLIFLEEGAPHPPPEVLAYLDLAPEDLPEKLDSQVVQWTKSNYGLRAALWPFYFDHYKIVAVGMPYFDKNFPLACHRDALFALLTRIPAPLPAEVTCPSEAQAARQPPA